MGVVRQKLHQGASLSPLCPSPVSRANSLFLYLQGQHCTTLFSLISLGYTPNLESFWKEASLFRLSVARILALVTDSVPLPLHPGTVIESFPRQLDLQLAHSTAKSRLLVPAPLPLSRLLPHRLLQSERPPSHHSAERRTVTCSSTRIDSEQASRPARSRRRGQQEGQAEPVGLGRLAPAGQREPRSHSTAADSPYEPEPDAQPAPALAAPRAEPLAVDAYRRPDHPHQRDAPAVHCRHAGRCGALGPPAADGGRHSGRGARCLRQGERRAPAWFDGPAARGAAPATAAAPTAATAAADGHAAADDAAAAQRPAADPARHEGTDRGAPRGDPQKGRARRNVAGAGWWAGQEAAGDGQPVRPSRLPSLSSLSSRYVRAAGQY